MRLKASSTAALILVSASAVAQTDFRPIKTPPEIARETLPSVIVLTMQDQKGQPFKLGTGFFVAANTVVTNFHVIDAATSGYAKIIGQPKKLAIEGIVGIDPSHDLALLQLGTTSGTPLRLDSLPVDVGDSIYVIGNPLGLEGTFSQGVISSVRTLGPERLLQITAPISPGSSGGPVLDQTGAVVGVSVMSVVTGQNLNFAIPVEHVTRLQKNQTELRPFKLISKTQPQETLFSRIGAEAPKNGVAGENFNWTPNTFGMDAKSRFSFSLHNKLASNVSKVRGFIIFYDLNGEPLDTFELAYNGVIPSQSAKRLTGEVDSSVGKLREATFWWDSSNRTWHKGGALDVPDKLRRTTKFETRGGKIEFRILDFVVAQD